MLALMSDRTGQRIASDVELAVTSAERKRGLLGRDRLGESSGLLLAPCWLIHTAFMRFPIDVVFVNREGVVVRVVSDLGPWRIAASVRAHAAIEFAAGVLRSHDVRPGDRLYLAAEPAPAGTTVSWPVPA